jgi:nucleotide-binding universal stress UspA family protein
LPAVIVPLDGSSAALAALPVARAFAKLEGATVHLLHVDALHVEAGSPPPGDLLGRLGLTRGQAAGAVLATRTGSPGRTIADVAREHASAMVVLCPRTGAGPADEVLGPVARELLTSARVPVVFVSPARAPEPFSLRRILVPHDGTPTTAEAVCPVVDLACTAEALLLLLHVAPSAGRGGGVVPAAGERGTLRAPFYEDQPQHEWPAWTREFLERACLPPSDPLRMSLSLASGDPASEIVRRAKDQAVDLVVLAWRGSLEPGRASILKAVIRDAPCPVLVMRTRDR